jgi:hypothetical protein
MKRKSPRQNVIWRAPHHMWTNRASPHVYRLPLRRSWERDYEIGVEVVLEFVGCFVSRRMVRVWEGLSAGGFGEMILFIEETTFSGLIDRFGAIPCM